MTASNCQAPAGDNRGRDYYRDVQRRTREYVKTERYVHVSAPLQLHPVTKLYHHPKGSGVTYVRPTAEDEAA